jgi:DNA polymerase III delta subunit
LANKKRKVLEVLKSGLPESAQVVLLTGSDEYLHDLLIKKFETDLVDPDFRDFNFRKLDCTRSSAAGVLAGVLSELPMLVDSRMVVFSRIRDLTKNTSSRLAEIWEGSLAPGTLFVVTAGGAVGDSPLWAALQKIGTVVDCRLDEKEIDLLLASFCRKQKRKADGRALSMLKERVGLNLRSLLSNLERCLLSLQEGEPLTPNKVEELVPFSAEIAMWKMTRAIGQRNHKEALAILDNQLDRGEPAGPIFSYINSYLVSLVQVGGMMKLHRTPAEVARAIPRKTEFQVKKTLEDLRTWSARDLTDAFDALARADFKSKGGDGGTDPKLLLQMLILKLCSRKQGRARR